MTKDRQPAQRCIEQVGLAPWPTGQIVNDRHVHGHLIDLNDIQWMRTTQEP